MTHHILRPVWTVLASWLITNVTLAQDVVAEAVKIDLVSDFQEARELAALEKRPLWVLLGADWCGWCRKLDAIAKLIDWAG